MRDRKPEIVALRCALYARYSSDQQRPASIEDQFQLNREQRASGATDRKELAGIEKKIASMLDAIEEGGYVRGMSDRLRELEARQDEIAERLATVPTDLPDIHPNIAIVYRRKVERLAEALADPCDRDEAAEAIRGLSERIVLTLGASAARWTPRSMAISAPSSNGLETAGRRERPTLPDQECRSRW